MSRLRFALFLAASLLLGCAARESIPNLTNADLITIKVLGINDFHGQIPHVQQQGGLVALASHLLAAIEESPYPTFIAHGGDHVGASPAASALLQDEPAITFLNTMQSFCAQRALPCQVLGTAGNHEFDEGSEELLRLLNGGNHSEGPFLQSNWQGANYATLSANVRFRKSQELLLKPYTIHDIDNTKVGFIGITLDSTPDIVLAGRLEDLDFEPQIDAVKHYVKTLKAQNVNAMVLVVHDGTAMDYYSGTTQLHQGIPQDSSFYKFVRALPPEVDLVVSGHSHQFTNAYVETLAGKTLLVTQAYSSGRAYSDITLQINPASGDVVNASAVVKKTPTNYAGALSESAELALNNLSSLALNADAFVKRITSQIINRYQATQNEANLGQFIANSHQYSLTTDVGVMNRGGVRAALVEGDVSWGDIFAIQPFSNQLVAKSFTGLELTQLAQQDRIFWSTNVTIDSDKTVLIHGQPVDLERIYTVAGNEFVLNSSSFEKGTLVKRGIKDVEATVDYIKRLPKPFNLSDTPQ